LRKGAFRDLDKAEAAVLYEAAGMKSKVTSRPLDRVDKKSPRSRGPQQRRRRSSHKR